MTVRGRIVLTLAPVLGLLIVHASVGAVLLSRLGNSIDVILRENYASVLAMEQLTDAVERIDTSFHFTLRGDESKASALYMTNWVAYRAALRTEQDNVTLPGEQELVDELTELTERYQRQGDAFYARGSDPQRQQDYHGSQGLNESFNHIKSLSGKIAQLNQHNMARASESAKRQASVSLIGFSAVLVVVVILTGLAGWYSLNTILGPVRAVARSVRGISAGNLDQVAPYLSTDVLGELADAFNQMTHRLRDDQRSASERTQHLVQTTETLRAELNEREKMERMLKRSQENLKRAQSVAHIGSWYLNIPRDELSWSDETYRIFGLAPGTSLTYEKFLGLVHPQDRDRVSQAWTAAMRGTPYDVEHRILVGGQTKWLREQAELDFDAGGQVVGGVGTTHDVTDRKQAEEHLRRSNRALVALSNCNQALIRATEEQALLGQICRIVVEKAGYRLCWVGFAEYDEHKTVRPVAQAGTDEEYIASANITWGDTERGRGPTGLCIRMGQPSIVKDIASEPHFAPWRAAALRRGYASCLGIPLIAEATTLGALTIYAAEPNAFADDEVALLRELADDLAFGITTLRTRAERRKAAVLQAAHDRDLKIGAEIQQALLTEAYPIDVPGLRIAALSVPSRQIDGDFYYFYKHEDQCLDVIVADVMGKGIPAALLAEATKSHFLEALCHLLNLAPARLLPQPREIVTLTHADLADHLMDLESFVTLCYLRVDPSRRIFEFVDAGHTGLIHCKAATGLCEVLHGDNLPLGFRRGEIYDQSSAHYGAGDLLVLFSDGVTEARNQSGELFGSERLLECIQRHRALEPEELKKAIRDAVFSFAQTTVPADDLTCVIIKAVDSDPPQSRASLDIRSDFQELSRMREFIRAFCRALSGPKLDETCVGKLELAATEACSNIIKHAYHGRTDQNVHVEVNAYLDHVSLRLFYLGAPFDPGTVRPPQLDGSQESGFGVYLIHQCTDVVRYGRDERGRNYIAMSKNR